MSSGPTSAADDLPPDLPPDLEDYEGLDPRVLLDAGWTPEELYWEELSATGLALAGRQQAAEYWREAARVAPETFAVDDLRRATSLANLALADEGQAAALLAQALDLWRANAGWVADLRPERRARSSLFHLRLMSKHRGGYDHWSRHRYQELYEAGLRRMELRAAGGLGEDESYALWRRHRPATFDDRRRLTGAVYLIAPDRQP